MRWTSVVAIYALLWVLSAFLVMPFGLRTPDEVDGHQIGKGHADSAPVNFRPGRIAVRATILAAAMMILFALNYQYGWVNVSDLNFYGPPPVKSLGY
jgi:predicted secreted protein